MQFTLDSITQYKGALQNITRDKEISEDIVLIDDLHAIKEIIEVSYFGIITVGNNVAYATLYNSSKEVIRITKNTQIIDYFTHVKFYDVNNIEITVDVFGHFRGFVIKQN